MTHHAHVVSLLLISALIAACTAQGSSPTATPAPTTTPPSSSATEDSSGPCRAAVMYLGAFTQQIAGNLASLRPLVVAKRFDSPKTAVASRRVAVTLTGYAALEQNLRGCAATAELVQRVELLRSSAQAKLKKSQSAALTNAPVQRATAAGLFGLLPEVLALSAAGKTVADSIGTAVEVAQISGGASKPLGKLAPLPTTRPRATPRPTARAAAGGGTTSSGWTNAAYNTAVKYTDSTWLVYTTRIPNAMWNAGAKLFGATCDLPTSDQRGSCFDAEVKSIYQPIQTAVRSHFAFMRNHPAARCFTDAYAADRAVGNAYLTAAKNLAAVLTAKTDAAYDQAFRGWDRWIAIADSRSSSFLKHFKGYFSDCR